MTLLWPPVSCPPLVWAVSASDPYQPLISHLGAPPALHFPKPLLCLYLVTSIGHLPPPTTPLHLVSSFWSATHFCLSPSQTQVRCWLPCLPVPVEQPCRLHPSMRLLSASHCSAFLTVSRSLFRVRARPFSSGHHCLLNCMELEYSSVQPRKMWMFWNLDLKLKLDPRVHCKTTGKCDCQLLKLPGVCGLAQVATGLPTTFLPWFWRK